MKLNTPSQFTIQSLWISLTPGVNEAKSPRAGGVEDPPGVARLREPLVLLLVVEAAIVRSKKDACQDDVTSVDDDEYSGMSIVVLNLARCLRNFARILADISRYLSFLTKLVCNLA